MSLRHVSESIGTATEVLVVRGLLTDRPEHQTAEPTPTPGSHDEQRGALGLLDQHLRRSAGHDLALDGHTGGVHSGVVDHPGQPDGRRGTGPQVRGVDHLA